MKLSKKWLNDYVQCDVGDKAFADAMTMSGSKVEGYEHEGAGLENIVVGLVISIERHPDSDHLWVCQVDCGGESVQIVTGAQNVTAGSYVPVAKDNSVVAGGKRIKKSKMRGVASCGMLCSLEELDLTAHDFPYADEDGIFLLGEDCEREVGLDIRAAVGLDDVVTEFEITANRPDCLSVLGLAREAAATFGLDFRPKAVGIGPGQGDVNDLLKVRIDAPDLCYRYAGAVVENVRVAPSPRWMRGRLRACGVRPINNIVDITNYVMLEHGQPMHAFDLRYLEGNQVIVRAARAGEAITTLDGVERRLEPGMLVIADARKPVAVAGVMGGEYSGVMEDTKAIVFESACFRGTQVRTTAKRLGLRTESSARFDKELDPDGCARVLARALQLVRELDAGDIVSGVVDVFPSPKPARAIPFHPDYVNGFIGIDCPAEGQTAILERIGCKVEGDTVRVPSWRGDLAEKADVAEEVARFYGYDKIPAMPLRGLAKARLTEEQKLRRLVSETLLALGYSEICTYSFISPKAYDKIGLPAGHWLRGGVAIQNPLGEDTSVMRTTPTPSMLEVLARNYNNRNEGAALFELATVYWPQDGQELPLEKQMVSIGLYGPGADYFALKGIVEALLEKTGLTGYDIQAVTDDPIYHPGRAAAFTLEGGAWLACLGEISPAVQENYGLGARAYAANIDFSTLLASREISKVYQQLPRYPAVTRDLALVCDAETPVLTLQRAIAQACGSLLEHLELFDVYTGSQIAAGSKSVAYSLRLRSAKGTLTDEEADAAVKRCVKALDKAGAKLRA
ncbi:MAG: phenylalanine--tRNA ligase subunit beta [Oscillospiraceae bacterium]|jgi:phenylalanyl-tRNA synthetase beta chain|nr:phenylalanine--tRNA ligase subunit beta [Oscillospiraceae bacterium]